MNQEQLQNTEFTVDLNYQLSVTLMFFQNNLLSVDPLWFSLRAPSPWVPSRRSVKCRKSARSWRGGLSMLLTMLLTPRCHPWFNPALGSNFPFQGQTPYASSYASSDRVRVRVGTFFFLKCEYTKGVLKVFSLASSVPFSIPGRVFFHSNPNVVFESRQRQLRGTAWVVIDKPPEFFDLLLNILSCAPLLWV